MQRRPKRGPVLLGRRLITVNDVVDVASLGRVAELHGEARVAMEEDVARGGEGLGTTTIRVDGPEPVRRAVLLARAQALSLAFAGGTPEAVDADCAALAAGRPLPPVDAPETVALAGAGAIAIAAAEDALAVLESAAARTWAALGVDPRPADASVGRLLPQIGLRATLATLGPALAEEVAARDAAGAPRLADLHGLRYLPQRHGAARDALRLAREVVETHLVGAAVAAPRLPDGTVGWCGNDDPVPLRLVLDAAAHALEAAGALVPGRLDALDAPLPPPEPPDFGSGEPAAALRLFAVADRCEALAAAEAAASSTA